MKIKFLPILLFLGVFASSPSLLASDQPKHFTIGLASFATSVAYDTNWGTETETFAGPAFFASAAVNDNVAFRLTYARQKHEDASALKLDAMELSLLAGMGMANAGLKVYGSLGLFSEALKLSGFEDDEFSGLMLGAGIGYNWNPIALEFWLNIRDTSDYEDISGVDVVALSGGLGLSARF